MYLADVLVPLLRADADLDGLLHEAGREDDGVDGARLGGRHGGVTGALWGAVRRRVGGCEWGGNWDWVSQM